MPWYTTKSPLKLVSGEKNTNEVILRIRFPHWVIGSVLIVAGLAFVALALLAAYEHGRRRMVEQQLERIVDQQKAVP